MEAEPGSSVVEGMVVDVDVFVRGRLCGSDVSGWEWEWSDFSVVGGKFLGSIWGVRVDHFGIGFRVWWFSVLFFFLSFLLYCSELDVDRWGCNFIVLSLSFVVCSVFWCLREIIGFCRVFLFWFVVVFLLVVFVVGGLGLFAEGG